MSGQYRARRQVGRDEGDPEVEDEASRGPCSETDKEGLKQVSTISKVSPFVMVYPLG